jgi:hypothetical protein
MGDTGKTKTFVLRMDEKTFAAVEKWAADEFRSVNGQLQWIVEQSLKKNGRLKKGNPPAVQTGSDEE